MAKKIITTTYNFEVSEHHTYFINKNRLWAHNACLRDIKDIKGVNTVKMEELPTIGPFGNGPAIRTKKITVELSDDISEGEVKNLIEKINLYNQVVYNRQIPQGTWLGRISKFANHTTTPPTDIRHYVVVNGSKDVINLVRNITNSQYNHAENVFSLFIKGQGMTSLSQ